MSSVSPLSSPDSISHCPFLGCLGSRLFSLSLTCVLCRNHKDLGKDSHFALQFPGAEGMASRSHLMGFVSHSDKRTFTWADPCHSSARFCLLTPQGSPKHWAPSGSVASVLSAPVGRCWAALHLSSWPRRLCRNSGPQRGAGQG